MKDRIRQIMESQHMTQQVFAEFIGMSPASLSSIFNDRTKPTLNIVEAIKRKIPDISTDWLMFGTGEMFKKTTPEAESGQNGDQFAQGTLFDSEFMAPSRPNFAPQTVTNSNGVRPTHLENQIENIKKADFHQRKVTEIRVYYDDQTWESFTPSKA